MNECCRKSPITVTRIVGNVTLTITCDDAHELADVIDVLDADDADHQALSVASGQLKAARLALEQAITHANHKPKDEHP